MKKLIKTLSAATLLSLMLAGCKYKIILVDKNSSENKEQQSSQIISESENSDLSSEVIDSSNEISSELSDDISSEVIVSEDISSEPFYSEDISSDIEKEEKCFTIGPDNFNMLEGITMSDVVVNQDYADKEFTFNANGYMTSSNIFEITKIVIDCYQTYENLFVYEGNSANGKALDSNKQTLTKEAIYTYYFTGNTNSFYIKANPDNGTARTHVFSIDIYYTGENNVTEKQITPPVVDDLDFASEDKTYLEDMVGFVIPYFGVEDYMIDDSYLDDYGYIDVLAFDMSSTQFKAYKSKFDKLYEYEGDYEDDYGDTWYMYSYMGYEFDLGYYKDGNTYYTDVCFYIYGEQTLETYEEFEEFMLENYGFVTPKISNVSDDNQFFDTTYFSFYGMTNYYAIVDDVSLFNLYKSSLDENDSFEFDSSYEDDYGDTWYKYLCDDCYFEIAYYEAEFDDDSTQNIIDIWYYLEDSDTPSGNEDPDTLITNKGVGLPSSETGIYNVDFTKADPEFRNLTTQASYVDGMPTTGNINVLVIPIEFKDITASSRYGNANQALENIDRAFNGPSTNLDYYSVAEYYNISSYGKLNLTFDVLDKWYTTDNNYSYYSTGDGSMVEYYGYQYQNGEINILEEILTKLDADGIDLSKYDSDNNGYIDSIVMINTLDPSLYLDCDAENEDDYMLNWAFRYYNLLLDENDDYYYHNHDKAAMDYLWASYSFLMEDYDDEGYSNYNGTPTNTYTFIHEFGHVLGATDYYDSSYTEDYVAGLFGCDVMDSMTGDHNPYSKFNYGWLTNSRLVVAEDSITLTLEDFSKNGDTIIIANNFDKHLGAYQEYYVLMYYRDTGLNSSLKNGGYFARDGVIMYHVNSSLYISISADESDDGKEYYDVWNTNDAPGSEYGTNNCLIELIKSAEDTFTYVDVEDDTLMPTTCLNSITDSNGDKIAYTFKVTSLDENSATIVFEKNN